MHSMYVGMPTIYARWRLCNQRHLDTVPHMPNAGGDGDSGTGIATYSYTAATRAFSRSCTYCWG